MGRQGVRGLARSVARWALATLALAMPPSPALAGSSGPPAGAGKTSILTIAPDLTPVSDYTGDLRDRSTLAGDLGGKRQWLYGKGVALDLGLTQLYQGVTSGGREKEGKYSATADYHLAIDSQRLGLWPSGLFVAHGRSKFGRSVNAAAGTVSPVNFGYLTPDAAEKRETFLEEYYVLQGFTEKLSLLAGRVLFGNFSDRNRFANDEQAQFLNTAFRNSPLLGVLGAQSLHGIGLSYRPTQDFHVAPFILSSNDKDSVYGSPGGLFSEYSVGVLVTLRWKLGGLPGEAYPIFGYNTQDASDLDSPDLSRYIFLGQDLPHHNGNWIAGFSADQYFYMPEEATSPAVRTARFDRTPEGIGFFLRLYYAPEDRNFWSTFLSGGIGGRGVVPSRPLDRYGLGFYALIESGKLKQQPILDGAYGTEYGWEAFYNFAVTPWLQLTPDFQYIRSGQNGVSHAGIFGVRLQIYF